MAGGRRIFSGCDPCVPIPHVSASANRKSGRGSVSAGRIGFDFGVGESIEIVSSVVKVSVCDSKINSNLCNLHTQIIAFHHIFTPYQVKTAHANICEYLRTRKMSKIPTIITSKSKQNKNKKHERTLFVRRSVLIHAAETL